MTDRSGSVPTPPRTFVVEAKRHIATGVAELVIAERGGGRLPDWTPGAHIDLTLPNGTTRQYSLCGSRWDPFRYRIAVLNEPNSRGGSSFIHETLRPGDPVGLGGPRNNFRLVPAARLLFIAGGIGITPLLPMIDQADRMGADWQLLYGGRTRDSMAYIDELERYGSHVAVLPEDEFGLLPLEPRISETAIDTRIYCCGPAPLLAAVADLCERRSRPWLRTERFVAKELPPAATTEFQVEARRSGVEVLVQPGQTIAAALQHAGVAVLTSCGQGLCGTCETTVIEGAPEHRDSILDDDAQESNDRMFVCVSRSRSERLVLDL